MRCGPDIHLAFPNEGLGSDRIVFPVQAPPLEARCCRHKVGGAGESVDHALATSTPGLLALSTQVE